MNTGSSAVHGNRYAPLTDMYDMDYVPTVFSLHRNKQNEATSTRRGSRFKPARQRLRPAVLNSSLYSDEAREITTTIIPEVKGKGSDRQLTLSLTVHDPESLSTFDATAIIDSGATGSYIDRSVVEAHNIELIASDKPIRVINADGTANSNGEITHYCHLRLRVGDHEEVRDLAVTNLKGIEIYLHD